MFAFSAAWRLPARTPSVRRIPTVKRALAVTFAAFALTTLPLRVLLALASIAEWTTSWQVIAMVTMPFVLPFSVIDSLNEPIARNLTLAEVVATGVFGLIALYVLAMFTVRRTRS